MFFDLSLQSILISCFIAIALDLIFSEVKCFHPLVGFGRFSYFIESQFNNHHQTKFIIKLRGCFSWLMCLLPLVALIFLFEQLKAQFEFQYFSIAFDDAVFDAFILYFVIGHKSLQQHALNIFNPLSLKTEDSITAARKQVAMMVSRKTSQLTEQEISRATVESVLENGHDAVIASLFWYAVGGLPLAILHRLVNTLDAMWGYKNKQFVDFGWCAAKMDDWFGWPSAKITAFLYAIQGLFNKRFVNSLNNARKQSQHYKSLNGGWVMASGATVLNIQLGGQAVYDNQKSDGTKLGQGDNVTSKDILKSIQLVSNAVWLWVALLGIMVLLEKLM